MAEDVIPGEEEYGAETASAEEPGLPDEPLGLSLIRRWHEDCRHIMEEFDRYLEHLEEPEVKKLIEGFLANKDSEMSAIEDFVAAHERYSDYPPIEGGDTGEMDEEVPPQQQALDETNQGLEPVEGAASGEGLPEPTPEEAVEGMNQGTPEQAAEEESESRPPIVGGMKMLPKTGNKEIDEEFVKAMDFYRRAKGVCPSCGMETCGCGDQGVPSGGAELPGVEVDSAGDTHPNSGAGQTGSYGQGLREHMHRHVNDGKDFLQKFSASMEPKSHEDDLKAHHYGELFKIFAEEIGGRPGDVGEKGSKALPSDKADVSPEKACKIIKDGEANGHELTDKQRGMFGAICGKRGKKDMMEGGGEESLEGPGDPSFEAFPEVDAIDDEVNVNQGDSSEATQHPHAVTLKEASTYLRGLAKEHPNNVNQEHRVKAAEHAARLDAILQEVQRDMQLPPGAEVGVNVGEVQEKSLPLNSLKDENVKQRQQMVELNNQLKALHEALKSRGATMLNGAGTPS